MIYKLSRKLNNKLLAVLAIITPLFWFKDLKNNTIFAKSTEENGVKYTLDEKTKTAEVADGKSFAGNLEIPRQVLESDTSYTVTSVGSGAFNSSKIRGLILPDSIETIKNNAFENCDQLAAVSLGTGLKRIEDRAFFWSSVSSLALPASVEYVGSSAFENCTRLHSLVVPPAVSYVGTSFLAGCTSLETVSLPDSLIVIPDKAFYGCEKLSEINFPANLEKIGDAAFSHCLIDISEFPIGLKTVGANAFDYCTNLSYIVLPDGLHTVGNEAFARCENLSCIEIPESVINVGDNAFGGPDFDHFTKLKKVVCVKNSYVDINKPFFFWVQYGITYPEFSYKVSGASASGSIFGEYSFMAYIAVGLLLIIIISGVIIVFKEKKPEIK